MLRVWQTIAITLVALTMGTSSAHVLEWPAKLHYTGEFYLRLQTSLYAYWGPPSITGFVESAAVLSVLFLAVLCRAQPVTLRLTVGAAICLLLAFPVVFFWRVAPANGTFFHAARAGMLPPDWDSWHALGNGSCNPISPASHRLCIARPIADKWVCAPA